jgi:RNA polymerase sigma-70 factor (ECF subfamily)
MHATAVPGFRSRPPACLRLSSRAEAGASPSERVLHADENEPGTHAADRELARAALAGDTAALRTLAERLACVQRYASLWNRRLGGALDESEEADVAQEVVILAWRKLATFNGESRLETWSYGLTLGVLRNAVRAKRRRVERTEAGARERAAISATAEGELDAEDERVRLHARLAELPREEAAVVELRHFGDLTLDGVAARLGIPLSTAKSRYYRALDSLARRLRRDGVER